MKLYRGVTGGHDLQGFWKMSPSELFAWSDAADETETLFDDMNLGEEAED